MKFQRVRRIKYAAVLISLVGIFSLAIISQSSYYHKTTTDRPKMTIRNEDYNYMLSLVPLEDKVPGVNIILFWTKYYEGHFTSDPSWSFANLAYPECFRNCLVTDDRRYLEVSDGVVFHSRDLRFLRNRKDEMPPIRRNEQVYIFLQQESPSYTKTDLGEYDNVFNWTMTFRRDSDVYHPYFRLRQLTPTERPAAIRKLSLEKPLLQGKSRLVAWIVSNCNTLGRREKYVLELQKLIPVDIYGSCGQFSCLHEGEGCFPAISKEYKFYLSFENSLCVDYITEKFSNALKHSLVPVVYGGGDYESIAPPGSFISTGDFKSPEALAEYLLHLDKHPESYLAYFNWRRKYKVELGDGWCSICQKMSEHKQRDPVNQSYKSLLHWWRNPSSQLKSNLTSGGLGVNQSVDIPACLEPSGRSGGGVDGGVVSIPIWMWEYGRWVCNRSLGVC